MMMPIAAAAKAATMTRPTAVRGALARHRDVTRAPIVRIAAPPCCQSQHEGYHYMLTVSTPSRYDGLPERIGRSPLEPDSPIDAANRPGGRVPVSPPRRSQCPPPSDAS